MKKIRDWFWPGMLVMLVMAFAGCSEEVPEPESTAPQKQADTNAVAKLQQKIRDAVANAKKVTKKNIQPGDVVLVFNGMKVTKGEYDRYTQMLTALFENRHTNVTKEIRAKLKSSMKEKAAASLMQRLAVLTKLPDVDASKWHASVTNLQVKYARSFGRKGETFAALAQKMEKQGYADLFKREMTIDLKMDVAFRTAYSNRLEVTDAEVAEVKKNVLAYNEKAKKANEETEARAAKILKLAKKGNDFATLADKYSQDADKQAGGDMGQCIASDFALEAKSYWETLQKTPVGGVTDVLMTEEGYEIVKVVKKFSPDESNSGESALQLARIFFRRAYTFPEQTSEDFKADVVKEKREKFLKEFMIGLMKASKIEFPCGEGALHL